MLIIVINLQEFKYIFFWEYIHRLLGRIIGLTSYLNDKENLMPKYNDKDEDNDNDNDNDRDECKDKDQDRGKDNDKEEDKG